MNNQIDTVKTFEQSVSIIEDQVSKIKFYEEKLSKRKEFQEYMRLKEELRILEEKTKPAIKEYMINHPEEFDTDDKGNLVAEGTGGRAMLYTQTRFNPKGDLKKLIDLKKKEAQEQFSLGEEPQNFSVSVTPVCRVEWKEDIQKYLESK